MVKNAFELIRDSTLSLSKNFKIREFLLSDTADRFGISNHPHTYKRFDVVLQNLTRIAEILEVIRAAQGNKPIYITSGFRCPQVNQLVKGLASSSHLYGAAVDFTAKDFDNLIDAVDFAYSGNKNVYYYYDKEFRYVHLQLTKYLKDND